MTTPAHLRWEAVSRTTSVAVAGDLVLVMTRVPAGRPNRHNLVAITSGEPRVLGRELTPGHCRKIAQRRSEWVGEAARFDPADGTWDERFRGKKGT